MRLLKGFSLFVLLPTVCFAADTPEIPQTAKPVYQIRFDRDDFSYRGVDSQEAAVASGMAAIQERERSLDLDLQCKSVYYKWNYDSSVECYIGTGWGPFGCYNIFNQVFGSTKFYIGRTLTVDVFCDPRGFDEKVMISLERSCEQKPEPNCLDDRVRAAMSQIKLTERFDIDKP